MDKEQQEQQHTKNHEPKRAPLCSSSVAPIMHFGVLGEGKTRKVLAFNSMMSSRSSMIVKDIMSAGAGPWKCATCDYYNSDHTFSNCSMCGHTSMQQASASDFPTSSNASNAIGAMSSAVTESDSMCGEGAGIEQGQSQHLPERFCSSLRMVLETSCKRSSIDPTMLLEPTVTTDPAIDDFNAADTSSLPFELANMSLAAGGWTCPDCTYVNTNPMHLTCTACGQKKPNKGNYGRRESIEDFLASSMDKATPGSWWPQMEAFLRLEEVSTEKERMALIVEEQQILLAAAEQEHYRAGTVLKKVSCEELLDNARESLKVLEVFYRDEKTEYDAMSELQRTKAVEIELVEGEHPSLLLHAASRATRPGVQRVTPQILEWIGQQRMLDDWKLQLDERAREIEKIRRLRRSVTSNH